MYRIILIKKTIQRPNEKIKMICSIVTSNSHPKRITPPLILTQSTPMNQTNLKIQMQIKIKTQIEIEIQIKIQIEIQIEMEAKM
jgi:hypothetical protein